MIELTNDLITRLTSMAQGVGVLVAIVMVLIALVVGRTLVKVLSTLVLVGVVLFAVAKPTYFKDKIGDDLEPQSLRRPPTTVVHRAPPAVVVLARPAPVVTEQRRA